MTSMAYINSSEHLYLSSARGSRSAMSITSDWIQQGGSTIAKEHGKPVLRI
jgi:hypothetical protein